MLIGISKRISPDLIKIMMEMGHGDELVLADGNFPSASHAQRLIRCDGSQIPELLHDLLWLFPLDTNSTHAVALMQVDPGDPVETSIWTQYREIVATQVGSNLTFEQMERQAFYTRVKKAYAVVATGESALYANLILRKGLVSWRSISILSLRFRQMLMSGKSTRPPFIARLPSTWRKKSNRTIGNSASRLRFGRSSTGLPI